ncbi:MAG: DNA methyltransferase, partial [candidate division WOR-3 bacterium]
LHPRNFKVEQTTVWSFKQRGNWATHNGKYRGNWSPYIPRNVIVRYSKPGELVLDYFCGAGTTAVEAKLLGRRFIGIDINDKAIELAKKNIDFNIECQQLSLIDKKEPIKIYEPQLMVGDARNLSFLQDNSIDLICAHPPYANIIHYTDNKDGDLSFLTVNDFLHEMASVARESFRVLKPGRQCAILIGDTRKKKHIIPLGFKLINVYLDAGFKLKELVIKRQHNCKTTGFWYANSIKYNFLLLAHEYLPIFEKPQFPFSSFVNDRGTNYGLVMPTLTKPQVSKKLSELETTSVWILPENDFEKYLNVNVIKRYSYDNKNLIIDLIPELKCRFKYKQNNYQKNIRLLFIKSQILNKVCSNVDLEFYLQKINEIINQHIFYISNNGYIVIQTKDIKINGYTEPVAKRIVDLLQHKNLVVKEIIIVAKDEQKITEENSQDLKIAHQYLLVYEVRK